MRQMAFRLGRLCRRQFIVNELNQQSRLEDVHSIIEERGEFIAVP